MNYLSDFNLLYNIYLGFITKEQWMKEGLSQGTDPELVECIFKVYDRDDNGTTHYSI
jgi:hypothetical protein